MVRSERLELSHQRRWNLNPVRLPIPPRPLAINTSERCDGALVRNCRASAIPNLREQDSATAFKAMARKNHGLWLLCWDDWAKWGTMAAFARRL